MTIEEDWSAVGERIEALAMKLKLHYEQATSEATSEVKTAIDATVDSIDAAFDGLRSATADPGIKEDVRQVAMGLRDALHNTFAELSSQLQRKTRD
jgi:pyruvate/oxaloacetate carboxyltransferase